MLDPNDFDPEYSEGKLCHIYAIFSILNISEEFLHAFVAAAYGG